MPELLLRGDTATRQYDSPFNLDRTPIGSTSCAAAGSRRRLMPGYGDGTTAGEGGVEGSPGARTVPSAMLEPAKSTIKTPVGTLSGCLPRGENPPSTSFIRWTTGRDRAGRIRMYRPRLIADCGFDSRRLRTSRHCEPGVPAAPGSGAAAAGRSFSVSGFPTRADEGGRGPTPYQASGRSRRTAVLKAPTTNSESLARSDRA